MIWLFLFCLIATAIVIGAWCGYWKYKDPYKDDDFIFYLYEHIVKVLVSLAISYAIVVVLCSKPLYHTFSCSVKGISTSTETSYSWVMGECLYHSQSGAWLPLRNSRVNPEGSHDGQDSN